MVVCRRYRPVRLRLAAEPISCSYAQDLCRRGCDERADRLAGLIFVGPHLVTVDRCRDRVGRDVRLGGKRYEGGVVCNQLDLEPGVVKGGTEPVAFLPRGAVARIVRAGAAPEPQIDHCPPVIGDRTGERPVDGHPLLAETLLTSEPFGAFDGLPLEEVGGGGT